MLWLATLVVCAGCPYATVQQALDAAEPGDTVRVQAGVYRESVRISREVRLVGEGAVIDGEFARDPIVIAADQVSVEGFEIRRSRRDLLHDTAAVRVVRSRGCRIENNRFVDNFFAVYLEEVTDCVVRRNMVEGVPRGEGMSANGIHTWNSSRLRIEGNQVRGHRDGIYLEFTSQSEIIGNESTENIRYGLHFMYSDDNRFLRNRFFSNGAGVAVMYSNRVGIEDNEFSRHQGRASYGLLLKEISRSVLQRNRFFDNSTAVHFDGSQRNQVAHNLFRANGLAVSLWASAEENRFEGNIFEANLFDFHTNSTGPTTNRLQGNYFSGYLGYDLDRDGFGDIPYRPFSYSAVLLARYPLAGLLAKSAFFELLDLSERLLPSFVPAQLVDEHPLMHRPTF